MQTSSPGSPAAIARLGSDWCAFADPDAACEVDHAQLSPELITELHEEHPFFGVRLRVIAHRLSDDDLLCAHHSTRAGTPPRYSIVHLTWSGQAELGVCPTIDADGPWTAIDDYEGAVAAAIQETTLGPTGSVKPPVIVPSPPA